MATRSAGERLGRLLQASDSARVGADLPRRSLTFDAVVTMVFLGLGLVLLRVLARSADLDDQLFVLAVSLPLVLRRRMPRTALGLVLVAALAQIVLGVPVGFHDAAVLFALYSAVGCTNRRFGLTALGVVVLLAVAGAATGWWGYVDRQLGAPAGWVRVLTTVGALVLIVAAWALGERLRSARLGAMALAERAGQLEREREQQARLAAAAERARIAREMHDVIAHGLSVMIVQADGAAYVVDTAPEAARAALVQIGATGRQSLTEMRNLLGLLRTDGGSEPSSAPQPDLGALDALVEQARATGAEVDLEVDVPADVPTMVSLTAYRIVQEGLTNARRHGGPAVRVDVLPDRGGLRVRVADHSPSARAGDQTQDQQTQDQQTRDQQTQVQQTQNQESGAAGPGGYGLVGVRERVAAVGGTVTTGVDAGGGFVLDAWLPLGVRPDTGGGA